MNVLTLTYIQICIWKKHGWSAAGPGRREGRGSDPVRGWYVLHRDARLCEQFVVAVATDVAGHLDALGEVELLGALTPMINARGTLREASLISPATQVT